MIGAFSFVLATGATSAAAAQLLEPSLGAASVGRATLNGSDEAVAYRINAAHTGTQSDSLAPPIKVAWSVRVGGRPSYPLIAGGRMYVIVNTQTGPTLLALDAATGATIWSQSPARPPWGDAYDQGRLYVESFDGILTALDAATGTQIWTTSTARNGNSNVAAAPPVAANGLVFAMASSVLEAYDGATGTSLHDTNLRNGTNVSSPAVDGGNTFVTSGCGDYSVGSSSGTINWSHDRSCSGGGGCVAAVNAAHVYSYCTDTVLNESTGAVAGSVPWSSQPFAVDSGKVFSITSDPPGAGQDPNILRATSQTGATVWTFYADSYLNPAPVVANGIVYVASRSGLVYLLDENTGQELYHVYAGEPVVSEGEMAPNPRWGMAIGEGLLAVPTASSLVVFDNAPAGTFPTGLPPQQPRIGGYLIRDLGTPQGTTGTYASSIAGGFIGGNVEIPTMNGPVVHPVLWTPTGYVDWASRLPPGRGIGGINGVNQSGIAVGSYQDMNYESAGFMTTASGTTKSLVNSFNASAINRAGVVAGTAFGPNSCTQAATWISGVETKLPMASRCGGAYAINDSGDVAGLANHAAMWRNGVLHDLGYIGGCSSAASAISPDDVVVGWSDVTQCGGLHHAVEWKDGLAIDLGNAGGLAAEATAIAPNDQTVVGLAIAFGNVQWPVVWRLRQAFNLQDLIDPRFGWSLGAPTAIDINGRISGAGSRYGSAGRGFVLIPYWGRSASQAPPASPSPRAPSNPAIPGAPGSRLPLPRPIRIADGGR